MSDYNDSYKIESYLTSLEGLNQLIKLRREAGYERKERLAEFVILGRWYLDSCGNFGKFIEDFIPAEKLPHIPPVLHLSEFKDEVRAYDKYARPKEKYGTGWSVTHSAAIPDGLACPLCEAPWTIENCHDAYHRKNAKEFYHENCLHIKNTVEDMREMTDCFVDAGFKNVYLTPIPNKYWSIKTMPPWYQVTTPFGMIEIGQRKRVINIDWSWTKLKSLPEALEKEEVTKGQTYIHAWGYSSATEYLTKIFEELKKL